MGFRKRGPSIPRGSVANPRAEDADLLLLQGTRGRHLHPGVGARDPPDEPALSVVVLQNGWAGLRTTRSFEPKSQTKPRLLQLGTRAADALVSENRHYITNELDRGGLRGLLGKRY